MESRTSKSLKRLVSLLITCFALFTDMLEKKITTTTREKIDLFVEEEGDYGMGPGKVSIFSI